LYFYFSGHGIGINDTDVAMLLANAMTDALRNNIGFAGYQNYLRHVAPFDELVFFLDCCRTRGNLAEAMGPTLNPPTTPSERFATVKQTVVMAALYGTEAFDMAGDPTKRHGLLTQALLAGMRDRKAVVESTGEITALSLRSYVETRVQELAAAAGVTQTVQVS